MVSRRLGATEIQAALELNFEGQLARSGLYTRLAP